MNKVQLVLETRKEKTAYIEAVVLCLAWVWRILQGECIPQIANDSKLHISTVYRTVHKYHRYGNVVKLWAKGGKPREIDQEIMKPYLYLDKIQKHLCEELNVRFSVSGIWKVLKKEKRIKALISKAGLYQRKYSKLEG
ncbi:hypothetical protein HOY82DRAFT_538188 [Tuber indicum]|nr:hypothetical protein HOY82DRAFT_538188 [Tuber indicum]